MGKIMIEVENLAVSADLKNTPTAQKMLAILPIEGSVNVWGEEIYFDIPLNAELEADAREEVEVGDLGYWPAGPAFCIFFGPTPISQRGEIKPANPVNVFGKIIGDSSVFKKVKNQENIRVEKA